MGTPAGSLAHGETGDEKVPPGRRTLTVNTAAVFSASVLTQFIGFIGSLFVYKYIGFDAAGQALFGTVQFFLLIASTINSLADLRIGFGYTLLVARGRPATSNTGTYLLLRVALVGVVCALVVAFSGLSVGGQQLVTSSQEFTVLALFMTLPILWTFETVYAAYFTGVGDAARGQFPAVFEVIVRTPAMILVAFAWPTMVGLAVAYFVGAAGSVLVCLPALVPILRGYRKEEAKLLIHYSWPLLGSLILSTVAGSAIPFVVQASLGPQALNDFNAANAFRILALSLPNAFTTPLFPYLAGLHKQAEYQRIRDGTWMALRYSALLLLPGVVALAVFRVDLLTILYNSLYASLSAESLVILVIAVVPASFTLVIGTGLAAVGWRRLELYLTAVQVGALFAVALALMPPFGLLPRADGLASAAIAVLASSVGALALNLYFMHRLMAVHLFPVSILSMTLASVGAFGGLFWLEGLLPLTGAEQLVLGLLGGFLLYFFVLAAIGELSREDIYRVGRSLDLPERGLALAAALCWRRSSRHVLPDIDVAKVPGLTDGYRPGVSYPKRPPPSS